jgi:peptidoglycan/xylan/chitin deacetylase (PgdA/CDA1 family)
VRTGRLFTTSWDDGCPDDLRLARLLAVHGIRGTFYASTGEGGRRLISEDDLALIGQGHELASHGRTHTPFPHLTDEAIRDEVAWGRNNLSRFGEVPAIVAPPRGKMNPRVVRVLREAGYAIRSAPVLGAGTMHPGILEPTLQFYPHGWAPLLRNMFRRRVIPTLPILVAWAKGGGLRERSRRVLRAAADRAPCVHLWGHSSEVAALDLWHPLQDVLRFVTTLGVDPVTNSEAWQAMR